MRGGRLREVVAKGSSTVVTVENKFVLSNCSFTEGS